MDTDFKAKFIDISRMIQTEFDRNISKYGEKIKCSRGCSECCSQVFRITAIDTFMIKEHLKSLPAKRQDELKSNARRYISKLERPATDNHEEDYNAQAEQLPLNSKGELRIPCPALGPEGECTIYEARPIVCRRFGIPLYDYKNPGSIHACHLNFDKGEEIIDIELIPNQTAIGMKWDDLKDEFLTATKTGEDNFTTIAHSILSN